MFTNLTKCKSCIKQDVCSKQIKISHLEDQLRNLRTEEPVEPTAKVHNVDSDPDITIHFHCAKYVINQTYFKECIR